MRKKIVAGNWKMNKTLQEGIELAKEVKSKSCQCKGREGNHRYSFHPSGRSK